MGRKKRKNVKVKKIAKKFKKGVDKTGKGRYNNEAVSPKTAPQNLEN